MGRTKIAINGFGRIGRLALRRALQRDDVEIVAINDLGKPEGLAYLFERDSVHGRFPGTVGLTGSSLTVDDQNIRLTAIANPAECGWGDLDVDVVLEATGVFTHRDKAALHLEGGAKRVLISAPATNPDLTICMGVNDDDLDVANQMVISNASCTTNCVGPVLKPLHDAFGITGGVLNTVHAYTMGQGLLDSPNKNLRRGRAAALNLVPTSTGAAKAVGEVIPDLKGKLHGLAIRTPNPTGSLADLTLTFSAEPSLEEVHDVLRAHAALHPQVLEVSAAEIVSSDVIGDTHSSIVDTGMNMKVGHLYKVLSWYDNEAGYATRLVEVATRIGAELNG